MYSSYQERQINVRTAVKFTHTSSSSSCLIKHLFVSHLCFGYSRHLILTVFPWHPNTNKFGCSCVCLLAPKNLKLFRQAARIQVIQVIFFICLKVCVPCFSFFEARVAPGPSCLLARELEAAGCYSVRAHGVPGPPVLERTWSRLVCPSRVQTLRRRK